MKVILYDDGFQLSDEIVKSIAKVVLKKIYDELPKEARRIDVIINVLEVAKEKLNTSIIEL